MARQFFYRSYKSRFRDVPAVIDHMKELQRELRRTDLANLQFFNITYFIITKNVYHKTQTNYFANGPLMEQLDINFAKYYFNALKAYIDGKPTVPAWKETFDFCKENKSLPLIYMALGVNAHINNDLGLTLFDTIPDKGFKPDYEKVVRIIFSSLDEVRNELQLTKLYKPFMRLIVLRWRHNAWKNYENLHEKKMSKKSIEEKAYSIAAAFSKVNDYKDFYHLYKIF